jgi:hypothetical protein
MSVLGREVLPPISMHKEPALNLKTHSPSTLMFGCGGHDVS